MDGTRDPFRVLSLPYDAAPDDVRRAFRRLARETHPDAGGSASAFHQVHAAYNALTADLERERGTWAPPGEVSPYVAGLDPSLYPTCPVHLDRNDKGQQTVVFDVESRPEDWTPGSLPPPGGACHESHAATGTAPAFGVWIVALPDRRFRCVFGPPAAD
ncbi:MAG: J domain-containing protein [Bacteroidota bacterium]